MTGLNEATESVKAEARAALYASMIYNQTLAVPNAEERGATVYLNPEVIIALKNIGDDNTFRWNSFKKRLAYKPMADDALRDMRGLLVKLEAGHDAFMKLHWHQGVMANCLPSIELYG